MAHLVAAAAGFHLRGVEWIAVAGAAVLAVIVVAVAAMLKFGVPVLGLAPSERHLGHRSKRLLAAVGVVVLLAGAVGVAVDLNRSDGQDVTHIAAGTTTISPSLGRVVETSGPTGRSTPRTSRPSSTHRPKGSATTGSTTPTTPRSTRRSSSTTSRGVSAREPTPTTVHEAHGGHTTPTTTKRRGTTTTRPPSTTRPPVTTQPPPTTEPPTTQPPPTTEPPTTQPPRPTGDLNFDGLVGCIDESILVPEIGEFGSSLPGDINHDGAVDSSDPNLMLANWTGDGTTWINPFDPSFVCL